MALTEQQRSEIYNNLTKAIGPKEAEFLMAQQPPGGWEQFATKRDLAELDLKTQVGFAEVHAKMDKGFAEVHAKMDKGFAEVKEQFAEVKQQFAATDMRFAELSVKRSRDVWAFIAAVTLMSVSICGSVFLAVWQLAPS